MVDGDREVAGTRPPRRLQPVALAGLVAAVAISAPPAILLDRAVSDWYEAVRVKPGHSLAALAGGHFDSTRADVEVYVQLRELAPGASYVVPVGGPSMQDRDLLGLALAGTVERPSGAPERLTDDLAASLEPHVVGTGVDRQLGPFAVVLLDDETPTLRLVGVGEGHWLVDERLLGGAP